MTRLTLPQQHAQETRQRILRGARTVFGRRGYGQATVEDIATEAGVSMGALYHHFSSKEELFKGLLDDHLRTSLTEFVPFSPATSLREVIEHFVTFQLDHLESDRESGVLSMEFWAQAAREDWARRPVAEFHRRLRDLMGAALRAGQSAGAVRADLDVAATAFLLQATFEGIAVLLAIDPDSVELQTLPQPWADLTERFIKGEGEADMRKFQGAIAALVEQPEEAQAASASDK